jgi:hypothetical protein
MEANTHEEAPNIRSECIPTLPPDAEPVNSLPLLELNVLVSDQVMVLGMLDPRSQIMVIQYNLAKEVDACINPNHLVKMEEANGATN